MSWKKAWVIYCLALAITALANSEKVSVWTDEHVSDSPLSFLSLQARRMRNFWRDSTLGAWSHRLDCALAPYFDGTYKNALTCRDASAPDPAEEALRERLDPRLPVLKADEPVDTASLLASLAPPGAARPDACPVIANLPAATPTPAGPETAPEAAPGTEPTAAPAPPEGAAATTAAEPPATAAAPAPAATVASVAPVSPAAPDPTSLTQGKAPSPRRLLVVGDSLAIGLSLSLRRCVAELDGVELIEEGKVSSGLANPRYYDWEKALRLFLDKYTPDLVVIMMGANDAKYINLNEKPRPAGSPNKTWPEVFAMRVENFLAALSEKNVPSYWIGLPIMGDPLYAKQAQTMNDIVRAECAKAKNSRFLETWNLLADDQGNYSTFLPNDKGVKIKVRANDKVHFTVAGGDILAQSFLASLGREVALRPKTGQEQPGRANAPASKTP